MTEQQSFISRIGHWFTKGSRENGDTLLNSENGGPPMLTGTIEPRSTFLRPWAKRDAAIENLQSGVGALADLMNTIRDNLEKQSARQEELLGYLSHLPEALKTLPENNRIQSDTLKTIQQQFEHQNAQQTKLGEILERISRADDEQGRTLDALQEGVETLREHDRAISENLTNVGAAMQSVSQNSQASTEVLQAMRDNQTVRDREMERILHRQGNRFTTMLAIAIFLSIAALVAVAVIGWLMLNQPGR